MKKFILYTAITTLMIIRAHALEYDLNIFSKYKIGMSFANFLEVDPNAKYQKGLGPDNYEVDIEKLKNKKEFIINSEDIVATFQASKLSSVSFGYLFEDKELVYNYFFRLHGKPDYIGPSENGALVCVSWSENNFDLNYFYPIESGYSKKIPVQKLGKEQSEFVKKEWVEKSKEMKFYDESLYEDVAQKLSQFASINIPKNYSKDSLSEIKPKRKAKKTLTEDKISIDNQYFSNEFKKTNYYLILIILIVFIVVARIVFFKFKKS
jgi:hypothetical protein